MATVLIKREWWFRFAYIACMHNDDWGVHSETNQPQMKESYMRTVELIWQTETDANIVHVRTQLRRAISGIMKPPARRDIGA